MKLENCGRCGLEPVVTVEKYACDGGAGVEFARCPARHSMEPAATWNAAQFAPRTERINAAALAIWAEQEEIGAKDSLMAAVTLIDAQDAAARARWAEMQKGGE